MTKKHSAIFDDVLSGLDDPAKPAAPSDRGGARFLNRSTAIAERLAGSREEKVLNWVDPSECRMWERHNRDYDLLNEENCRDLIDGIRSQGRQEFPAIVRALPDAYGYTYEVICGARRHFAVSWLRANNYTQFKYLVEVRELTDEEAFRLADIENRDREDISDYERAIDYADAIARYYGGKQKAMAERLEVSQPWLSRYLALAKLPEAVVAAFGSKRDIRERHARDFKAWLADSTLSKKVLAEAERLSALQSKKRAQQSAPLDAPAVMKAFKAALTEPKSAENKAVAQEFAGGGEGATISVRKKGRKTLVEFDETISNAALLSAFEAYLANR
ncbi:ParB/RepB/Spo0J family partition protein [Primorskyibacter sp. S187A]|uniref:ParB/RepB/Spo0J family partition protein n=1 Tax=Primorskyibacter sp. S187A TaxID=3415130 RepID=UPI003C7ECEAE